ncbi:TorD/DmsD family molecular chaperone [Candidatus Methanoperedens nitratireducens]|uniref:Putative Cytoplasmic chaperone TorD family protein n=1 Tax=Candidatus Methanoperedens nitratireducens TaxID=1392998 RepID=A0A284VQQ0_9EURY|nr:molecular chaperone TorD family protein [Candidatus Methanoperedens nitroreducens]SNQ61602.1 putative Cytoplasmic chaperone TorD family protein [Candidatus Methanoperedens nitroreducens]
MTKEFYRISSLIFYRPDREFAAYLRDGFLEDIKFLDSAVIDGFSTFLEENREKNEEEFYKMLAVEYTRLFTSAIPAVPCPPYESVYREDVIMGDSTLCALECYNKAGLKVIEKFHDLPDHVAVELEFLYYLMNYGYTEAHDSFMEEHFSKWVPEFCDEVEKNDRIGFYRHAAKVLREFVDKEEWKMVKEV